MNKWALEFDENVIKELKAFDKPLRNFIITSLDEFISNFSHEYEKELLKIKKIKPLKGNLQGFYRLRLRSYRVIYQKLDDKLVIYVLRVADRKHAYK